MDPLRTTPIQPNRLVTYCPTTQQCSALTVYYTHFEHDTIVTYDACRLLLRAVNETAPQQQLSNSNDHKRFTSNNKRSYLNDHKRSNPNGNNGNEPYWLLMWVMVWIASTLNKWTPVLLTILCIAIWIGKL